ncbi:hypothetical protein ACA910_006915 [Epithemia clementina (nom. ined.)]
MDPDEKRQKALTPNPLRHTWLEACYPDGPQRKANTSSYAACTADLAIGAYFFAMRSCKYTTVKQRAKTKLLTLGNINFKRNDNLRAPINPDDPQFENDAYFVSITFVAQKNAQKNQTRTQCRTTKRILCHVCAWGRIIRRIHHYMPNALPDTPVNTWFDPDIATHDPSTPHYRFIRDEDYLLQLRSSCASGGGLHRFGYRPENIGTHSIRSGAAMALFLAQNSILKIMILGRWSSAAFVRYIRPQVMEWTAGMSLSMLRSPDFRHANPATMTAANGPQHPIPSQTLDPLQSNLDAAIESPEELKFSGSTLESAGPSQLNMEI